MRIHKILTTALALSICSSPALAGSAAPLSVAASVQRSAPADARPNDLAGRSSWVFAAILIAGVIALVVFVSIDDDPSSP